MPQQPAATIRRAHTHAVTAGAGADAEIAILRLFLADGAYPSVNMASTGFNKRRAIVAVSSLDVVGCVQACYLYRWKARYRCEPTQACCFRPFALRVMVFFAYSLPNLAH